METLRMGVHCCSFSSPHEQKPITVSLSAARHTEGFIPSLVSAWRGEMLLSFPGNNVWEGFSLRRKVSEGEAQ